MLGIACTCWASTCRSGSDTVISTPSRKPSARISGRFRVFVTREPTSSPMGVMATSAPTEKSIMPATSSTAPARKPSITPLGTGATVRLRISTSATMGRTAASASRNFSSSFSIKPIPLPRRSPGSRLRSLGTKVRICENDILLLSIIAHSIVLLEIVPANYRLNTKTLQIKKRISGVCRKPASRALPCCQFGRKQKVSPFGR